MAFKARENHVCDKCKLDIPIGSDYTWSRKGEKRYYHVGCANPLDHILEDTPRIEVDVEPKVENKPEVDELFEPKPIELPEEKVEVEPPKPKPSNTDYSKVFEGLTTLLMGNVENKLAELTAKIDGFDDTRITKLVKAEIDKIATPRVQIEIKDRQEVRKIEGIRHKKYPFLLYLLSHGLHVYLYGPSGSGKTKAAELAAEDLKQQYGYLSLNPQTPDSRIIGCRYADGGYRGTVYRDAWDNGHLFCFDEIDNASSALMATLNSALGNGIGTFPDGMVKSHENFKLVVTGNTAGYGANPAFPERRPLDAAIRDRFCFIEWGYDEEMERSIAMGLNANAGVWVTWCHKLRQWTVDNMPKLQVTSRAIYRLSELSLDKFGPIGVKGAIDCTIFKGIDTASVKTILATNPLPEGV